jgi:hypothetical protein
MPDHALNATISIKMQKRLSFSHSCGIGPQPDVSKMFQYKQHGVRLADFPLIVFQMWERF